MLLTKIASFMRKQVKESRSYLFMHARVFLMMQKIILEGKKSWLNNWALLDFINYPCVASAGAGTGAKKSPNKKVLNFLISIVALLIHSVQGTFGLWEQIWDSVMIVLLKNFSIPCGYTLFTQSIILNNTWRW